MYRLRSTGYITEKNSLCEMRRRFEIFLIICLAVKKQSLLSLETGNR